jgi:folate-dependent phosphoribosylglycinamide formyltransferase PurN
VSAFVILTTADLPEAYFLAAFLESRGQRFAMVNIVARPISSQLGVLARLRRNRGTVYLADLLLARAADLALAPCRRLTSRRFTAFPEVDARLIQHIRSHYPRLDCRDPHTGNVVDFVREFGPDYLLLAGSPILRPSFYGLARRAALNRHLGLVPDFRGSDCAVWAFALDRPESAGYSIHVVTERVDAGDVIVRRPVPVGDEPTLEGYLGRLQREASNGFVEVIDQLLQGAPLSPVSQAGKGRYFPPAGWSIRRQAKRNFERMVARDSTTHDVALEPAARNLHRQ